MIYMTSVFFMLESFYILNISRNKKVVDFNVTLKFILILC